MNFTLSPQKKKKTVQIRMANPANLYSRKKSVQIHTRYMNLKQQDRFLEIESGNTVFCIIHYSNNRY